MAKAEPVYRYEQVAYCSLCNRRMVAYKTRPCGDGKRERVWHCKNKKCSGKIRHGSTIKEGFEKWRRH